MTRHRFAAASSIVALALFASACGGSDNPGTGPSGGGGGGGTGGTVAATITITAAGVVSPSSVTVSPGQRVTFVNNDTRPHDMASNPHPAHTDCPEINTVGFLQAGQSGTTQNLNTVRTCGFHDHNQDTNTSLQGTIRIQ